MNGQPHNVDDHVDEMMRSCRHIEPTRCITHHETRALCRRKSDVRGVSVYTLHRLQ